MLLDHHERASLCQLLRIQDEAGSDRARSRVANWIVGIQANMTLSDYCVGRLSGVANPTSFRVRPRERSRDHVRVFGSLDRKMKGFFARFLRLRLPPSESIELFESSLLHSERYKI